MLQTRSPSPFGTNLIFRKFQSISGIHVRQCLNVYRYQPSANVNRVCSPSFTFEFYV